MKNNLVKAVGMAAVLLALASGAEAQKVIRLSEGVAPGPGDWKQQEKEYFSTAWNTQVVTNVTQPALIVYAPDAAAANGTAVVVCPGGGFHALSINSEGIDVAKWLAARGVTAFVLKYRLFPTGEDGTREFMEKLAAPQRLAEVNTVVVPLAVSDAMAAMSYVRKHAAEFGVSPTRIGLIGFSAGGTLAAAVAFGYTAESRPDFVAPIYAYMGAVKVTTVPQDAPPMFVAAASDDQLGLTGDSLHLYSEWFAAKKPVELHIYAKGGHGFGMRKQNLPSDNWIERFGDWLRMQGLLTK
ncbi:MAG TPA: alpha/beta hydrolase [Blastocatellia bacterium]|nr:alpha/beta hydrolase [Blastocatellia bacterium]